MTLRQAGGCLAMTVTLMSAVFAQSGAQADKQFQGALHKEMVEGDLKAAIEEDPRDLDPRGRRAGDPGERADADGGVLSGSSAIHSRRRSTNGLCATRRPERPRRWRAHVGGGPLTATTEKGERAVWTGPAVYSKGRVSPDGRFLTARDQSNGGLMLHDLRRTWIAC